MTNCKWVWLVGSSHDHLGVGCVFSIHNEHLFHSLEMLDKSDVPPIPDGYPLVVAMNALLDAIQSVAVIVNGNRTSSGKLQRKPSLPVAGPVVQGQGRGVVEGVVLSSSWSGVLAALALLLDSW